MATAYLVVSFLVSKDKPFPCFAGARVYSEPGESLSTMRGVMHATVTEARADTYQEAVDIILRNAALFPSQAWLLPWLVGSLGEKTALEAEITRNMAEWKTTPQLVYVDGNYVPWSNFLSDR